MEGPGEEPLPQQSEPLIRGGSQRLSPQLLRKQIRRSFLWPLIFALGCWGILLFPSVFPVLLPCKTPGSSPPPAPDPGPDLGPAPPPSPPPRKRNLTPEEQQLVPPDRLSAWQVGQIAGLLQAPLTNGTEAAAYLEQAAAILRVPLGSLTRDKVLFIGELIDAAQHTWAGDTVAWLVGALTLVNVLWTLGICGIAISIGPVLFCCFQPLLELAYYYLLIPLYIILLRIQVMYEPLAYFACLYIIALADCFASGAREWIVVTGLVLCQVAATYWSNKYLWDQLSRDGSLDGLEEQPLRGWEHRELIWLSLACLCTGLSVVPMAVKFASGFLGFIFCGALYGSLASYLLPRLCGLLEAREEGKPPEATFRGLGPQWLTSLLLCVPYLIVKVAAAGDSPLVPFQVGLAIFGPVGLFVWSLVLSSREGAGSTVSFRQYIARNGGYIVLMTLVTLVGHSFHVEGFFHLGLTFSVLWIAVKIYDVIETLVKDHRSYVVTLYISVLLWLMALFFQSHPEWLLSLLS